MRQRGKSFLNFDICYIRHLLRFYPFFFTNTVKICLLKKLLLVSIFKIQCNEYFCLQNYEKTVRNKHIKTTYCTAGGFLCSKLRVSYDSNQNIFLSFWPFVVWTFVALLTLCRLTFCRLTLCRLTLCRLTFCREIKN